MRALASLFALIILAGCGGDAMEPAAVQPPAEAPTTTQAPAPAPAAKPKKAKALPGLPRWTAGYRSWKKLASDLPPRDSDPHLGTKNVYASRPAKGGVFPVGTVVVKEGFRPGKDFIGLIATMRKIERADPSHGDWVWVEWARDEANEPFTELARDSVCWTCHMAAADKDYLFTAP